MAEIITENGRKAIKKMAEINNCVRALDLMPSPEDFALRVIGDVKVIAKTVGNISTRINDILDRYASIPAEFLIEGLDYILEKLNNIDAYSKFLIAETSSLLTDTATSIKETSNALGSAMSATTSAALQIGGGLSYASTALGANIALTMSGDGRRNMTNDVVADAVSGDVDMEGMKEEFDNRIDSSVGGINDTADAIRDWSEKSARESTREINDFFNGVGEGIDVGINAIDSAAGVANKAVDDTVGVAIEFVTKAKREIEEQIEKVKAIFDNLTKNFDETFGYLCGKNALEESARNISNTAYEMGGEVFGAVGEVADEVAQFINNFNIGKVVTAIGGIVVGAGAATLAMDLLPDVDVDKMLKRIIGGVDKWTEDMIAKLIRNKYYEDEPDLLDIPDVPWRLSVDDLEKYNAEGYNKYLEEFGEENDKQRQEMLERLQKATTPSEIRKVTRENKQKMRENKTALKAMRKVRRDAIKARQIEKYKGFLKIELDYLKKECQNMKVDIKNEWDSMMKQYRTAIAEIKKFFTTDGSGGNDAIDKCCDRINKDAEEIVELCQSITVEITNVVGNIPIPYAVGSCFDMPVHKILEFFKDVKIVLTFLKNLIRLGTDIISQMTILAKIVCGGITSLAEIMETLMKLIGVDKILKMIDFIIALFGPKMIDAKILLENSISPIYYNETDEYEAKVEALEALLEDDKSGGHVEAFKYTDDPYCRKKYDKKFGGKYYDDDDIEELLEELEAKGEREIVAYRSPILNSAGDDFAGWVFYHAYAYDKMKKSWNAGKKRRRNKLIKKASRKNKMMFGKLVGGVAQLKKNRRFGYYNNGKYISNSVNGFDAFYWYTKWTSDPTDCNPDFDNVDIVYDEETGNAIAWKTINENVVTPVQTTANGSLVELNDGRRVFVEGKIVQSGDYVNVDGVKYKVK